MNKYLYLFAFLKLIKLKSPSILFKSHLNTLFVKKKYKKDIQLLSQNFHFNEDLFTVIQYLLRENSPSIQLAVQIIKQFIVAVPGSQWDSYINLILGHKTSPNYQGPTRASVFRPVVIHRQQIRSYKYILSIILKKDTI